MQGWLDYLSEATSREGGKDIKRGAKDGKEE